jgi:DNA polymerase-3 subunit delta'
LPTILSRCQLIKIPPIDDADIVEALMKGSGLSDTQARQLAAVSEGNYREARLLVQHAEEDWLSLLREWLNALLKNGPMAQVKWVEEISKLGREKQKQFLRYFNHLLELAIRLSVLEEQGAAKALMLPENEMDFITKLNKISNRDCQEAIVKELDKASYYIERNANGRMLFHALTIKLYHIIADKSLILID